MQGFEIEFVAFDEFIVDMSNKAVEIKPPLINLTVDPTKDKQVFNHEESYGYDEVIVNAITGDTLEITPSKEEQSFSGVYTEVKSKGVTSEVDENIKAENIKGGVNILGVEGTLEAVDYWSTEPSTSTSFNFKNYLKALPKELDLTNIKTLSLASMVHLEEADLSNWKLDNITSLYGAFNGCTNLKRVILKNHKFLNITTIGTMFYNCKSLEYLDMRDFEYREGINTYNVFGGDVPNNAEIIVKSDTERQWLLTMNSWFTNIKTVAELGE